MLNDLTPQERRQRRAARRQVNARLDAVLNDCKAARMASAARLVALGDTFYEIAEVARAQAAARAYKPAPFERLTVDVRA